MKRALLLVLMVIIIAIPLISCDQGTTATVTDPAVTQLQTDVSNIKKTETDTTTSLATVKITADTALATAKGVQASIGTLPPSVPTVISYIDGRIGSLPQGQSVDLSPYAKKTDIPSLNGYYTSAQVDAAIKKALDEYKASLVSGGTPTPTGTVNIIPANVSINQIIPLTTPTILAGGSSIANNTLYFMQLNAIKNLSGSTRQVTIYASFTTQPSGTPAIITSAFCNVSQGYYIVNQPFSVNPVSGSTQTILFTLSGIGIASGFDTGNWTLQLQINSATAVYWIQSWWCTVTN